MYTSYHRTARPIRPIASPIRGQAPAKPSLTSQGLDKGIIFQIMAHNTDMDLDPPIGNLQYRPHFAMSNLRSASQVNRAWRSVAIYEYSDSLWSRVVNLSLLIDLKSDYWFNLVLSRIGNSSLDVKCEIINKMYPDGVLEMLKFIQFYWGRIRRLDIGLLDKNAIVSQCLKFLALPAPVLESLNIRLAYVSETDDSLGFRLFSDVAPALREFHCSNVRIDINSPWLANLRSLYIEDHQRGAFNILDLCKLLYQTPRLESLEIRQAIHVPDHYQNTRLGVDLYNLRNLVIGSGNEMTTCWDVVQAILETVGCCLVFKPKRIRSNDFILTGHNTLHRYLNDYNTIRRPSFIKIVASPTGLQITDHPTPEWSRKWHSKPTFEIDIPVHPNIVVESLYPPEDHQLAAASFLQMVYKCNYSSIVHLDLNLTPEMINAGCLAFGKFIQSFESVEVLTTSVETLDVLCHIHHTKTGPIFPRLRTLKMSELKLLNTDFDYLSYFLKRQQLSGTPVETFEFTLYGGSLTSSDYVKDFRFLDKFDGLIVKWRSVETKELHEYLCGSRGVEELLNIG